jgi:serine/threonine protein kinase
VTDRASDETSPLPPEVERCLDRACDHFEAAWAAGQRPDPGACLAGVPEPDHPELLRELILLEVFYRRRAGETPQPSEYAARFPVLDPKWIRDALSPPTQGRDMLAPGGPPAVPGYELLEVLGRGGMGVVYRARHVRLDRVVALKMILAAEHAGPEREARFRHEAESAARLQHPNIVQVFEVGEHDGYPYLALEYVAGGNLAERLGGLPQPSREAAELIEALARAVQHAHERGVIHRDLKPANVLLAEDGTPKVADFGLAKRLDVTAAQTQSGELIGTPRYMAPEQALGRAGGIGPATDVHALGAILYEALTGRPPFQGATLPETLEQVWLQEPVPPRQLQPHVPVDLETVCLKCLRKEPRLRYASAEGLAEDLRRFLAGEPVRARPLGRLGRLWRWCRRRPLVAALTASLGLALTAGFVAVFAEWRRAEANHLKVLDEQVKTTRERDKADQSFRDAEETVDRYLTRVSQSRLLRVPGMRPLRLELLAEARDYYRTFLRRRGDDPALRPKAAYAHERLSLIHMESGQLHQALAEQRKAVTLYEQVAAGPRAQADLAYSLDNLGLLLERTGQPAEALTTYRRSRDLLRKLVDHGPSADFARRGLALVCINLSNLHANTADLPEARRCLEEARALQEKLTAKTPADLRVWAELATTWNNLANPYGLAGRHDEALLALQQAYRLRKKLAALDPKLDEYRSNLAQTLANLGYLHRAVGRWADSLAALEKARALQQPLAEQNPEVAPYRSNLARTYRELGSVHESLRKPDEAAHWFREALTLQEKLASADPGEAQFQAELGATHNNVGNLYRATRRPVEAGQSYRQAIACYRKAGDRQPHVASFRAELAGSYRNLGDVLAQTGQPAQALGPYGEARALLEKLSAAAPGHVGYRTMLAGLLNNFGGALDGLKRSEEALAAFRQATALQRQVFAEAPLAGNRESLTFMYRNVARVECSLGRPEAAAEAVCQWQKLWPNHPGELYQVARAFARCVPVADRGEKEGVAKGSGLERYAELAMTALRQAVAAGFADRARLHSDPDLAPLRPRTDFQQLLVEPRSGG